MKLASKYEAPINFESPQKYKFYNFLSRVVGYLAAKANQLNYGVEPVIARKAIDKITSLKLKKITSDSNINIKNTLIKNIPVRIYKPSSLLEDKTLPILIHYHGGGYFMGNLDIYNDLLSALCLGCNVVVISVDYRMAPEHPFPVPTNDCYVVTKYILESGDEIGDTNKVVLIGDSAGGNSVAVMTQRLNEENVKQPILQILIYPWVQMFNNRLPSHLRYEHSVFRTGKGVTWYLGITEISKKLGKTISYNHHTNLITDEKLKANFLKYTDISLIPDEYKKGKDYYLNYSPDVHVPNCKECDEKNVCNVLKDPEISKLVSLVFTPEISPGLAEPEKLKGLPQALFVLVEMDPLKDEGLIYAHRLKSSGVNVDIKVYENGYHGVVIRQSDYEIARIMENDIINYIKKNV